MSDLASAGLLDDPAERQYVALAVRSRRRLLAVLRSAGRPMTVVELAAAVGLHVTTTRDHLRVLQAAGLVESVAGRPGRPGRPGLLWALVVASAVEEGHRRLAELLADAVGEGGEEGRRRAEAAGRRWAEVEFPEVREASVEEVAEVVGGLFERLGFAPRRMDDEPGACRLVLEACPFRDVARRNPDVVCTVHLGLLRGGLARLGLDVAAERAVLRPFVGPDLCEVEVPGVGLPARPVHAG